MRKWLNLGDILRVNAKKFAGKIAIKDINKSLTFSELNTRVNKLANAFLKMGLKKSDKVAILSENSLEFIEVYIAAAKTGVIVVPINFRLLPEDIGYILNNSDAKAFFFQSEFNETVVSIKKNLKKIPKSNYILIENDYEKMLKKASSKEPNVKVSPEDPWVILYTSGTTGKPKGVVRSHESYIAFYLINAADFCFREDDICLNIMPLCHVNSTFFSFTFTYIGGSIYVHPSRKFNPVNIFKIIHKEKITFISLIPTHYNLMLNVDGKTRRKYNLTSIRKLLCSSAPATTEMKKGIMKIFPNASLYEAYGSTEAGIVTVLKPHEQFLKLASIGRESYGTGIVRILDEKGKEVKKGQIGELYSYGPMLFNKYYKMPKKTKESFVGKYFSAGDMAKEDKDGYYYLIDRKNNMIITGGEHVFPSEVEKVILAHKKVFDSAVIGLPHKKWGEAVTAVVVPQDRCSISEEEIINLCKSKLAKFKVPKSVIFIKNEEMPRTASGKILHRKLRERFSIQNSRPDPN